MIIETILTKAIAPIPTSHTPIFGPTWKHQMFDRGGWQIEIVAHPRGAAIPRPAPVFFFTNGFSTLLSIHKSMDGHHMCLRINTEPTLQPLIYGTKTPLQRFVYGARCALKDRNVYSIWPIQNIVVTKKYLKLHLARHICISQNTYRVILFTSLPYSIIRKN